MVGLLPAGMEGLPQPQSHPRILCKVIADFRFNQATNWSVFFHRASFTSRQMLHTLDAQRALSNYQYRTRIKSSKAPKWFKSLHPIFQSDLDQVCTRNFCWCNDLGWGVTLYNIFITAKSPQYTVIPAKEPFCSIANFFLGTGISYASKITLLPV